MSTTIDQRVVEMRFDNRQFESNVSTTMSTLDKLKQKLNFKGASQGLTEVGAAANKVNMNGLSSAVETVSARFSAMQVVGVTALANITNSAINTGKRMLSALTIDPVKTGFQEYETQMNSVQTILANTASKGSTIEDVNRALDELNTYADKTIYNFTEMTRNIGTFTAAGIELETSTNAIQGIANLAAVSGSNSQQASTAMYQLSQALAAGTVKLMDWNSVVNAGMGGEMFQNALRETSELLGTGAEQAIATAGSFRESLSQGWITSEVLIQTLKKFTTTGANEYIAEYTGLTKEAVAAEVERCETLYGEADAIDKAAESLANMSGKSAEEIKNALAFAKNAEDAATKVKTFTQLWDVLKESAQSGWSQTWKLIVGDFEQAKNLLSPLAEFLTGIIGKISDARNALLEGALGKSFRFLLDEITGVMEPIEKVVSTVTEAVKDYDAVVNEIINGDWGNGQKRWDALAEAGYDWAHAQNLVNERLGNAKRHATDYAEAQNKVTESHENSAEAQKEVTEVTAKQIAELAKLSDAELKTLGYTDKQIAALRELAKVAEKTGIPLEDFIKNIDEIDGRYLIFNGLKNVGMSIVTIFKSIGEAWRNAFPPMQSETLFNLVAGFHKLTTKLVISEETANNLTRTLKGVFAIIDIVATILGGGFRIALKVVSAVLSHFNLSFLEVTALVGDAVVSFRDWFESLFDISGVVEFLVGIVEKCAKKIREWIDSFKEIPKVKQFIDNFNNTIEKLKHMPFDEFASKVAGVMVPALQKAAAVLKEWFVAFKNTPQVQAFIARLTAEFEKLKDLDLKEIGRNIIEGLKNGLGEGAGEVIDKIVQLASDLISQFCAVLGIHSPSKEFEEAGGNIIDGLFNGLQNGIAKLVEFIKSIGSMIVDLLGNVNWGKVFAVLISTGFLYTINNISKAIGSLASPFEGLGDLMGSTAEFLAKSTKNINRILKGFGKTLNAFAFSIRAKALKDIAVSLLLLVGAVAVIALLPQENLWKAVGIVSVLAAVLVALSFAVSKMSDASVSIGRDGAKINGIKQSLLSIAAAMLILAITVKILGTMDWKQGLQGIAGVVLLIGGISLIFLAFSKLVKGPNAKYISKAGSMLMKVSIAILLLIGVIKLLKFVNKDDFQRGKDALMVFGLFIGTMGAMGRLGGPHISKFGTMCIKLGIALMLMVCAVKLIGTLSEAEMKQGVKAMIAFVAFVGALAIVSLLSKGINGLGKTMLAISVSMILLIGVCKLVGYLTPGDMIKGGIAIALFAGILYLLVQAVKPMRSYVAKIAGTLLAFSASIAILAGVAILLSLVDVPGLIKGITAVTLLGGVMTAMIWATRGAADVKGNLIAMTVAIGLMAAAVALLSFIKPEKLAGATIALATLMGMFALMEKMAVNVTGSMVTMIVMTVVIGLLAGILWLLQGLPVENTLAVAASLSMLMLSLSASLKIVSMAGPVAVTALIPMALMVVIMGLLGGLLYLLKDLPVESTMTNVIALSLLVISMTLVTALLGALAPLMSAAMTGVLLFGVVIAELALVLAALGGLAQIPGLEWLIGEGGDFLQTIGTAIGQFVGGIVGGIAEGAMSTLPQIGTYLSDFMTNASGFISGAQGISPEMMEGVKTLAEAILIITGAQLLNQLTSWISGGSSLADFGSQLADFGKGMKKYSDAVTGIDIEAITASAKAAKELANVAKAIPASGDSVWSLLAGEKNLGTFGTQLTDFGAGMKEYSDAVTGIDTEAITASATAAESLAKVAKAIPKNGDSLWSLLSGEQDLGTFGSQLSDFGKGMKQYSEVVTGINILAIITSATAAKSMVEVANAIPKNGDSLWSLLAGERDLGTFGEQMTSFGRSIKTYGNTVAGINAEAITASVTAAKGIVNVANSIPKGDSFWSFFTGKKDLSKFGEKLVPFGESLKKYANKVSGINADSMTASVNAAKSLSKFISGLGDIDTSGVNSFKSAVSSLAETNVDGFVKAFNGSATKMATAGGNMIANITKGVNSSKGNLNSTANSIVSSFASSINSKSNAMTTVGTTLANKFVSGFEKSKNKVKNAASNMVSSCTTALRGKYKAFYNAGSYLVTGFCNGISMNSYKAAARAKAMAQDAERAAKEELGIKSPSRKFIEIGGYVTEGFAIGISKFGSMVKRSVTGITDTAINTANDAMSWIAKAMDSDIEYQPTIRPVMDLSGVNSGVNAINGMLNGSTLGVSANLNAVNSMMGGFGQNGNDDIVDAIDKLGKLLNNTGTTNYNINGVTYDDGSNIHSAVEAIVRAARIGGRV